MFFENLFGGQLMAVVGRDGNDQMYPIAWAVVEGENTSSWEWFITKLQVHLQLEDGDGLAILSDENQAILSTVARLLPKAEHRHCARHIFALWHRTFKGDEMKELFWRAAKSYNISDMNEALANMEKVNPLAVVGFKSYNPKVFCRAHLKDTMKVDVIVNNLAETFNGYIINARVKHLIYMLEDIRVALMHRLVMKKGEMEKSSAKICPRIQVKLEREKELAANCLPCPSSTTLFQVNQFIDSFVVDIEKRTCTCRKWDMTGIPCCHAVSCIYFCNKEAEDYVADHHKREMYLRAYAWSIPPCTGERHWPVMACPLTPPPIKIGPGRPRLNRRKDPYENPKKPGKLTRHGLEMTCSICKEKGHNKKRCLNRDRPVQQEPPMKRPVGRPRDNTRSTITTQPSNTAQPIIAEPSRTGRGGRVIRGGRGSRGGRAGGEGRGGRAGGEGRGERAGGQGRGGRAGGQGRGDGSTGDTGAESRGRGRGRTRDRGRVPTGFGVLFGSDGSAFTNVPRVRARPTPVVVPSFAAMNNPPSTQESVNAPH
ncbi:uncharacterized protein LOC125496290 [Beta vulgaris subsp. vulgaris]|uniref:uncharacterized protein LOC125496290 n=1 Tax=Beta vulgaris subsp. vulgaris TaxID=3555 RepID=UPI0025471578|nr:uncharacterized protein LOC125496290 [Beta vulgaris subsp. vulgaris]